MSNVVLLELVFFFPAVLGALAFAGWIVYVLRAGRRDGGDERRAGPDDLARSV